MNNGVASGGNQTFWGLSIMISSVFMTQNRVAMGVAAHRLG